MIIKYEKAEAKEKTIDGKAELVTSMKEVATEAEADYIHICGHDMNPPQPCRRVRIKK